MQKKGNRLFFVFQMGENAQCCLFILDKYCAKMTINSLFSTMFDYDG